MHRLKAGYDPFYARYSPFNLLSFSVLRNALTEYDFFGGTDVWKLKWTKQTRPHYWLFVFSRTIKGHLLHLIKFQSAPFLKRQRLHRLRSFVLRMATYPPVAVFDARIQGNAGRQ
jgi:CelD/BcsL family acetyltransferase involved in cellulose biosynthesis